MQQTVMILDGGSGACLIRAGMPKGVCPEAWAAENPEALIDLQRSYVAAGSDAVCSFTFGANRVKLASHGLADKCEELNEKLASISKEAVGGMALVGGDIGPTGLLPKPFGDTDFDTFYTVFAEQAKALEKGGADYITVETMMSLTEVKAALLAAKSVTDLPVYVSITCGESGRTLSGCSPAAALVTLQANGADAFGLNCSLPPEKMLPLFEPLTKVTKIALTAKPNGEYPAPDGSRHFVDPDTFAEQMKKFADIGVLALGGCCGSEPEHISALSCLLFGAGVNPPYCKEEYLATEKEIYSVPDEATVKGCGIYTADAIFDAVDAEEAIIRVKIDSSADAEALFDMLVYANAPISLVASDTEAALRAAGICPARFLLDPESSIPQEDAEKLTRRLFAKV